MTSTRTVYTVPDISCDHCVAAITGAVGPIDGVASVDVDVDTKTVTVDGSFDDATVRHAIDDAGYEVTG